MNTMENSFFEYRKETGTDSGSETEFIDNSLADESFGVKKKNHTVFVAESEESTTDEESEPEDNAPKKASKSVVNQISAANSHVTSGYDISNEDASRGSISRQLESSNEVVLSSSDEEEVSPEIVPKRRPPMRKKSINPNESIIGRKNKKRMMLIDSDTENSIIIEHDKHKKLQCLKDTPLKIDTAKDHKLLESSMVYENPSESNDSDEDYDEKKDESVKADRTAPPKYDGSDDSGDITEEEEEEETDDDGPDEDQMVMSRATRMSIMGVIPKDNDSDESDFIQSDDSPRTSNHGSTVSLTDLPEAGLQVPPKTPENNTEDLDSSKITCSPFSSPLQDITNVSRNARKSIGNNDECIIINDSEKNGNKDECIIINDTEKNASNSFKNKVLNYLIAKKEKENYIRYDDDVTIVDTMPEIIALSSDDEDEVPTEKKSPKPRKSPTPKQEDSVSIEPEYQTIRKYLAPPSYPNQEVIYVTKQQRESELLQLEKLKEDLKNVNYLLEEMDVETLPDKGSKLLERHAQLEERTRRQGDRVANMVVGPENPSAADIAREDVGKHKKPLTWDELQKASNDVQPRMFGKQAMATHMAERNLILDRLRDLHESLGSRPAESQEAPAPRAMKSKLMPYQLHALAWLRWRETQRPRAGILADDMGLGKTITMIALVVSDKEDKIDDEEDDGDDDRRPKGKLVTGGTLVVCPASLMQQWGDEVTKHCASSALSVCLHHGANRATIPHRLATYDIVLTTYNIMQRDNEKNGVLMRISWRRVILDEAHVVRNHKSATCAAVSSLRARRRWCLTGTPVQNKDLDLFALLKFLRCSPFDDLTMWKKWIDNKSLGGQERLNTIMQCILLRRTKVQLVQRGQLACLPQRSAHVKEVKLSPREMNVYQKVLVFSKTLFGQFLHQRAEKNADAQGFTAVGKNNAYAKMHKKMIELQGAQPVKSHEILVLLLRLRQICCHCGLIAAMLDEESATDVQEDPAGQDLLAELNKLSLEDKRKSHGKKSDDEDENEGPDQEGTTAAEAIRSVLSPNNPVFELSNPSSKITAVMDCLNKEVFANKGDKAVVVSQWTSVLRLVEAQLHNANIRCVTLSGNVPVPARQALVQKINDPQSDVKVMLLSLCAGGVGLNLCGANHLLLLDPHWNPQLEEQAQDRIYRVGQTKDINIYRFMCVDTVEQSIRTLQQAKLELAENVLTGAKKTNNSKLTIEDLKVLFNMGQ